MRMGARVQNVGRWVGRREGNRVSSKTISKGSNRRRISRRVKQIEMAVQIGFKNRKATKPERGFWVMKQITRVPATDQSFVVSVKANMSVQTELWNS
jgi:hypothetical protein